MTDTAVHVVLVLVLLIRVKTVDPNFDFALLRKVGAISVSPSLETIFYLLFFPWYNDCTNDYYLAIVCDNVLLWKLKCLTDRCNQVIAVVRNHIWIINLGQDVIALVLIVVFYLLAYRAVDVREETCYFSHTILFESQQRKFIECAFTLSATQDEALARIHEWLAKNARIDLLQNFLYLFWLMYDLAIGSECHTFLAVKLH